MDRPSRPSSDVVLSERYVLRHLLGAGGMGEVWAADDVALDRTVAVKLLAGSAHADGASLARFDREARTAANLDHRNLVTVFDYGESELGLYLVMELVEGETLAACLRRGPLPVEAAVEVVADVADALAVVHEGGIVHRDVTPANVMLTDEGAKLVDFGIASGLGDPLTATGSVVGTAAYLAPERLHGERAGPEADVYALGAVLYESISGQRAFRGSTPTEVAAAHLTGIRPDLAAADPSVPAPVVAVCDAALAADRRSRPTAAELSARLRGATATVDPPVTTEVARAGGDTAVHPLLPPAAAAVAPPVVTPRPEPAPRSAGRPPGPAPERSRRPWIWAAPLAGLVLLALLAVWVLGGDGGRGSGTDEAATSTDAPTTAPPATDPPATEPSTTTPAPTEVAPPAASEGPEQAAVSYFQALDGGDLKAAWALTTPAFQASQDRSSWEGFWSGFDAITITGEVRPQGESGRVVVPLQLDGQQEDYELVLAQGDDGAWLVDGPVGR